MTTTNNAIIMNETNTSILAADGTVLSGPVDITLQEATQFVADGSNVQHTAFDSNGKKTRESFLKNFGTDLSGKNITSAEVALRLSGLDFEVMKVPSYNNVNIGTRKPPKFVAKKGVYDVARKDTGEIIGYSVSENYPLFQNAEAFDFLDKLVEDGAEFVTATLFGGTRNNTVPDAKIMICMKIPEFMILGDSYAPYLMFLNNFNKTGALSCNLVNMRVFCSNAINRALKGATNRIALSHSKNMLDRIALAGQVMKDSAKYNQLMAQEAEVLALKPFSENQFYDLAKTLIPIRAEATEGIVLRKEAEIGSLMAAWNEPDLANMGETAYRAIQAVSDYESHMTKQKRGGKIPTAFKTVAMQKMPLLNQTWDYVLEAV